MTPKIIDASSCISSSTPLAANPVAPRHKQQSAKQFHSVKWQSNGVVVYSQPINGFIIRPPDNQPLKRQSPKSYSVHTKNDHQLHYHNSTFQQQQPPQMTRQQQQPTQRYSPSRVSPTVNGVKRGSSAPPVSNAGGAAYAGAKFSEPPAPNALPKPPTHWMSTNHPEAKLFAGTIDNYPLGLGNKCCAEISDRIKILLNMQA